jgi:hypothetical protein
VTTDEIIQALTLFTPKFPREALSEAIQRREELSPRLLDSLDYVAGNVNTLMEKNPDYNLHFFAVFLLAQFREQRAFPKLVGFLHSNADELEFILGDILTENYHAVLCSTYNGDISLLQEVIENDAYYEFARIAAVKAYTCIVRDGHASRDEMVHYFHRVSRNLKDGDMGGANALVDVIVDEHIFELLPEAKNFYDRDLVSPFIYGSYDSFINLIFDYTYNNDKKIHVDDVIAEIENWACYAPKTPPEPEPMPAVPPPVPAGTGLKTKKKIGRNDPCPCGSGKKYKKCCLPKGITFREESAKEEDAPIPKSFDGLNLRDLYDDRKPYNLLNGYPGLDPAVREGERKFAEFFSPQAIEIDVPVYKALHHRAIPLWIRRNHEREDRERIGLLLEAFTLFTQTCARDGIDSFDDFDGKYMVHYHALNWITSLRDLLEKYEDEIPEEHHAMLGSVSQTLERMART